MDFSGNSFCFSKMDGNLIGRFTVCAEYLRMQKNMLEYAETFGCDKIYWNYRRK